MPRDYTKPRTDPNLTAEWVEERMRPGMMIEEDDGTLRPIGMVEANKLNTKRNQERLERIRNGVEPE